MIKNRTVLSQNAFIRKLGKEITIYPRDMQDLQKSWDVISTTSAKLLPEVPDIGILSKRKRLLAYQYIDKRLDELLCQGDINDTQKGYILLLMKYSSRQFGKAFAADNDVGFEIFDLLKVNHRKIYINLPLALIFVLVVEYKASVFEKAYNYFMYYPEQQVQGVITRSERGDGDYYLAYDYQVNGVSYTGTWVSFKASMSDTSEYALQTYPVKRTVSVYYNEQNPATAVLEREGPDLTLYLLIAFVLSMSYMSLTLSWGRDDNHDDKRPRNP
jgi:hypothetical protein